MKRDAQLPMLNFRADVQSVDQEARTARVVWSTGARVLRPRFLDEPFYEELDMSPGAVRMERLQSGRAPLLDSHRAFGGVGDVIGVVEDARLANGEGLATVRFSEREDADQVFADVRNGIIANISVGYRVYRYRDVTQADDEYQVLRAIDWEPMELSAVPIAADQGAQFREHADTNPVTIEGRDMVDEDDDTTIATGETQTRAERDRVRGIYQAVRKAQLDDELADDMIERDLNLTQARAEIADKLVERQRERSPELDRHVDVTRGYGGHGGDFHRGAVDGILLRCGIKVQEPHPAAHDFRGSSIIDIARDVVAQHNGRVSHMGRNELVRAALSTSDFANILQDAINTSLLTGMMLESSVGGFRRWTRSGLLQDFKQAHRVGLSEFPDLEEVPEGSEYRHKSITDFGETIQLSTFGNIISFTRQAIINDNLDALTRVPNAMGMAASRTVANQVYNVLLNNPTMRDGNSLFDETNHGNDASSGTAVTVTALSDARAAMRKQTGEQGAAHLNIEPQFLIVGADRESEAEQVMADISPDQVSNAVPAGIRNLELVVDPRLDDSGNWFVAADPGIYDTVEVAYLDGAEEPFVEQKEGWNIDGAEFKVRIDYGTAALDWRGLYRNSGA